MEMVAMVEMVAVVMIKKSSIKFSLKPRLSYVLNY
jgi:hypothetical protein